MMRPLRCVWLGLLFATLGAATFPLAGFPREGPLQAGIRSWWLWASLHPWSPADFFVRRAEKHFETGKFQDCLRECEQAVLSDPDNSHADVLLNEVNYILALDRVKRYPRRMGQMDGMLSLGRWYFLYGYSYHAEDQANRVLELGRDIPADVDPCSRVMQARELLSWIQRERDRDRGITDD